jgi:superfamily I DNA/RNA helicase
MNNPESIRFSADTAVYLAAAGSGKTTALMDEMTGLLGVYRPDETAFVTYTRKGVANGIERALQVNPQLVEEDLIYFKTLHALCFRELGLKRAAIITKPDLRRFSEKANFNLTSNEAFDKQTEDDKLLTRYDVIRSGSKKDAFIHGHFNEERYNRLVAQYEEYKKSGVKDQNGTVIRQVDFYDCLLLFKERNKPVNVKVAFIDEAQDLTMLQWEVCQIAFSDCEKVRIAGDDYQSLFSYAGASPRTLIDLAARYRTVKLETSYRLPAAVYRFAKGIVEVIDDKIDKDFKPAKDMEGFVEDITDRTLLMRRIQKDLRENGVLPYRWYLLFRNNCFIDEVAAMLEQFTIPYHTSKGFCIAARDLAKIKRYYSFRKKGYGSADALEKFCADHHIDDINDEFIESGLIPSERRYVYYDYVQKFGIEALEEMSGKEPFLLLSTTHRVKGGEADYVAVFLDCTGQVSYNSHLNTDEEARVLYVACTRARIGLYLVASRGRYGLDRLVEIIKGQVA